MENRNVFNLVFEKTGVLWTLVLSVILSPFAANAIQHTSAVPIQSGEIRGFVATLSGGDQVTKYLGIPYAKAARFENPGPPTNWTGVKDMVTTGKACRQVIYKPYTHFTGVETIQDMSEDCLNLNVYVPHNSSNLTLPVMVWIHEGTFVYGSNRLYDGSIIATNGKVIVVSINFRLGVFGFLATGNTAKDLKGNYGLFDQVQALKWVQENIDKFGGDPNKVTIFGNTVGGASVSLLCLSPLANGLFQNAIMQSGASNAPWAVYSYKDSHKKIR
ncbi:hypothetical protein QZH41_016361 [Actinostola sp. cb2023]|nr:hypothetical protein QZH41_016361 [Actinostola sp. cb2023]